MCESQADDRACTGSFEMSACHQLSAGNSEQRVPEIGFASVRAHGGAGAALAALAQQTTQPARRCETGDGEGVGGTAIRRL